MTRQPGNTEPEPPGGRAAERLREFIAQRFPRGLRPAESAREEPADADRGIEQSEEHDADEREIRRPQ